MTVQVFCIILWSLSSRTADEMKFTFMHLADAFIQSNLHLTQALY